MILAMQSISLYNTDTNDKELSLPDCVEHTVCIVYRYLVYFPNRFPFWTDCAFWLLEFVCATLFQESLVLHLHHYWNYGILETDWEQLPNHALEFYLS